MSMKNSSGIEDNLKTRYWYFRLFAFGILLIYFFIVTFPDFFHALNTGLDPSWKIVINYAATHGLVFGKDIVFTYGPLGYLLTPLNLGKNLIYGAVFQIIVHLLWILVFIYIAHCFNLSFKVFVFVFLVLIAISFDPSIETQLLFLIPFFLTAALNRKHWLLIGVPTTIFAATCLLIKFNIGFSLFMSVIVYSLLWFVEGKENWKIPVITASLYTLSVVILWLVLYGNLHSLYPFLSYSWEIAKGFSMAMGGLSIQETIGFPLFIRIWDLPLALTCIAILLLLFFSTKTIELLKILFVFAFPAFICFKHGFVREDFGHIPLFFSWFLLMIAWILLCAFTKREKSIAIVLVFITILSVGVVGGQLYYGSSTYKPFANLYKNYTAINNLFHWSMRIQALNNESNKNLSSDRLPEGMLSQIDDKPVDIIPWNISYIIANQLNWDPSPVFQSYSAYTSKLDNFNAKHLSDSSHAPRYIIYQFASIDNRHPFFDEPKTLLEMYRWYNAIKIEDWLLLRRRNTSRYSKTSFLSSEKVFFNKTIIVPDVHTLLLMKVHAKIGAFWKLVGMLYRLPTFTLIVKFDNGDSYKWRLVPETMEDGIIINVLPTSLYEAYLLFGENKYISKVKSITFLISNYNFMTPTLTIDWITVPINIEKYNKTNKTYFESLISQGKINKEK